MKTVGTCLCVAAASVLITVAAFALEQDSDVDKHRAKAQAAAGQQHKGLFEAVCAPAFITPKPGEERRKRVMTERPPAPERSAWYAEPVRVFDNLVFVGQSEFSAWAVLTSEGIILIDTIYDYSVEAEIVDGLRKLGLDPAQIKYALVSHGHYDHAGGARYLQEKFGTRIVMSAADWDMMENTPGMDWRPKRDLIAEDGMRLTLGDTTLMLYLTPGHTQGTISTLIPVRDNGVPHLAAEWGGTMLSFPRTPQNFQTYIDSAERFRDIAKKAGADVVISNHTLYDGTLQKVPALQSRQAADSHPYVVGGQVVADYLTVVDECARAGLAYLLTH